MEADNDYYEILDVPPSANGKVIRAAYRALAQKHHPDRAGGDSAAVDTMSAINEAYRILGDPQRRAQYDRLRAHPATETGSQQGPQPGRDHPPATAYRAPRSERARRSVWRRWAPSRVAPTLEQMIGCLTAMIAGMGVVLFVGLLFAELLDRHEPSERLPGEVRGLRPSPGPDWGQSIGPASDRSADWPQDSPAQPMQEASGESWYSGDRWDLDSSDSWNDPAQEPFFP